VHRGACGWSDAYPRSRPEGVRLWNASRRLENRQTHRLDGSIDTFRVNRVAIVDHESVPLIARHNHPKLLRGPVCCRMLRHVPMQDSSCTDFQNDKHVDHAECGCYDDKEIIGERRPCVVPHEGAPRLCSLSRAQWSRRQVPSHGPRVRTTGNAETLRAELSSNVDDVTERVVFAMVLAPAEITSDRSGKVSSKVSEKRKVDSRVLIGGQAFVGKIHSGSHRMLNFRNCSLARSR
jgi:hypothetical protein